jgi:formylglycine-generating enzyme required for sulfatase activity
MKKMRHETRRESVDVTPGMKQLSWALSPNFGWLTVTSVPSGLTVRVNGKEVGTTPLNAHELDPGYYEVLVSDPRYVEAGERFNFAKGERKTVAATLTPREGWIKVQAKDERGNAVDGEVWVDGAKAGKTYAPAAVLVGSHNVEVRSPSGSWSGKVEVREKEVTAVAAKVAGGSGATARSKSGIEMVLIRPGAFTMGSPSSEPGRDNDETQHTVTISRGFYLGTTEVTVRQFRRFVAATNYKTEAERNGSCWTYSGGKWVETSGASWANPGLSQDEDEPVVCVSWNDAVAFTNWLSDQDGLTRCYGGSGSDVTWNQGCTGYRLPTEAEWEYAARAGTTTAFSTGACLSTGQANYDGNNPQQGCPKGQYRRKTVKVGSFAPNAWGLYDVHGNVWEWAWDWKADYPSGTVTDPVGPGGGSNRVHRGGSWSSSAQGCRSANRSDDDPGGRHNLLGLRLARSAR